jgi:hypothetical protein
MFIAPPRSRDFAVKRSGQNGKEKHPRKGPLLLTARDGSDSCAINTCAINIGLLAESRQTSSGTGRVQPRVPK